MQADFLEVFEVELKYCERCGGLWLRPLGMREIYSSTCIPLMADLPLAKRKRPPVFAEGDSLLEGECQELFAICSEGGHA